MKMKIKQRGFTLLELLVVLLIIGMLVAYVGPKYFGEVGKSQAQIAAAQIESFGQALDQFRVDTGHYPTQTEGLAALYSPQSGEPNWNGPYLKKNYPPDPWGNPYVYNIPSASTASSSGSSSSTSTATPLKDYDLISYGADGKPGGTGLDADITN
jgi:general secretion pathway protein G